MENYCNKCHSIKKIFTDKKWCKACLKKYEKRFENSIINRNKMSVRYNL